MIEEGNVGIFRRFANLGEDGSRRRLGIMGGTFDPIHLGHLRIAEEMREALKLDGVLFIPAGTPVFKKEQDAADADLRMESVRKAIADNPYFDVSPIEVHREGNSYTVDTLEALRELFPKNVDLFFIVGSDAAFNLPTWKQPRRITALAQFVVATGRPDGPETKALKAKLDGAGFFDLRYVPVSPLGVSSTDIRARAQEGKSLRYLIPEFERFEILEAMQCAATPDAEEHPDPLSDEFYEYCKEELAKRVSEKRFEHSLAVAQTAESLAGIYGVNPLKARLAGILHDWDKGYDDEGIIARVQELGLSDSIDPRVVEKLPFTLHGITAAKDLSQRFPFIPEDVISAIRLHTVASTKMTPLEMVVYVADGIEPNRHFGNVEEVRALVGEVGLDRLFFESFKYWTTLLISRGKQMHPNTVNVWNAYVPPKEKG